MQGEDLVKAEIIQEETPLLNEEIQESYPDIPKWVPVIKQEPNETQGQVIFDKTDGNHGLEIDEDYYDYQDSQAAADEAYQGEMTWPFPDPDASLPPELYQIHKNQWLRSQYELWLQKVAQNKALVEQYYNAQN